MKRPTVLACLAGAAMAGLAGIIGATTWSDRHAGVVLPEPALTQERIARGAYLARLGDCAACHSVPGKAPFSGGLWMETPIGAIFTSNITPDRRHGIGNYSLGDFDRALRYGVAAGHTLYPAMPYSAYSITRPEDVAALYAYFRQGVQPDPTPNRAGEIPFPLSMRWPLTVWRWLYAPVPQPFGAPPGMDAKLARGAYLVQGLGHCGDCHTARGPGLQVRALGPAGGTAYLAGAMIDGWHAPSLRNGGRATIGTWSEAEIAQFLRSGANRHGSAFASMSEVIVNSTRYMTEDDAMAAARFLKSLNDKPDGAAYRYDPATGLALRGGDARARGARLYLDNCAACHRPDGKGYERVFPPLAGNPVVAAAPAESLIRIVLAGTQSPRTPENPAQFAMPAFAWRLSDKEVADVVTFVRASWGNQAPPVEARAVGKLRRTNVPDAPP
ncbi:c-type cytochrome [Massilia dura]|uniref:C-type cytochrome n=1 Tax=Pseudoduganella dura TaxID=321982 RepID=A0A6I3X6D6_9BURK|nr:cytochrome c [Pseudoduganella dura]MUI11817.1 c-type cytochrome [Pseudoduganella dura]GGX79351.1 cytochrome c [Pseudoduganella dura]